MNDQTETTMPVAVWVDCIGPAKQAYVHEGYMCNRSAEIQALTSDQQLSFELTTNPLSRGLLEKIESLSLHGFTVVEVPTYWTNEYSRPPGWRDKIINLALDRVMQWQSETNEQVIEVYDEAIANEVLALLLPEYPRTMNMIDMKHSLSIEPSDARLLTTLFALQLEKLIDGDPIHDPTFGRQKLRPMTKVRITRDGKQHLLGAASTSQPVVHQYNNYGQTGAQGPHATGTVNIANNLWQKIESQIDLNVLANQLEQLRLALLKSATSREDSKQIGIVAEAEEAAEAGDGSKVMAALSKVAKSVWEVAENIGTDIAARVIVEASKG